MSNLLLDRTLRFRLFFDQGDDVFEDRGRALMKELNDLNQDFPQHVA